MIDHKARLEAIASLKNMLKSWLDENYYYLDENDRKRRAESMDMSLVEARKAEDMQTLFEFNNLVWTSMIEMQFMKKVSRMDLCRCAGSGKTSSLIAPL